jgi:hypothetical protein
MKLFLQTILLATLIFATGCYTQLETIQREAPRNYAVNQSPAPDRGSAYDDYYSDNEWAAYEEGYYDGVFDTEIAFRDYRRAQTRLHVGFGWGRPFYGFGYSYGYYYDPYWHWAQLYDPYFFAFYGYYGYPYHLRFHRYAFFHSPFWGHRPVYIVHYNNYYTNRPVYASRTGPRSSGVHRGNSDYTNNRQRNNVVDRAGSSRVRGGSAPSLNQRPATRVDRNRTTRERGTVDRNRGTTTRGTVDRNRTNTSRGNVQRGNTNRESSGTVNRGNRTRGSSATPSRSRGGNNESGSRNRGGNEISQMPNQNADQPVQRVEQNRVRTITPPVTGNANRSATVNPRPLERPAANTLIRNNAASPAAGSTQRPAVNNNRISNNASTGNTRVSSPSVTRNNPAVRPSNNSNNNRAVQQNRTRNSSSEARNRNTSRDD